MASVAYLTPQSLPEDINILLFKILVKEWTGYLDCQNVVFEFQGNDRLKPGFKTG
ncbi:MAG: hypothetical protein MZV63_23250 [Marinilabiliales bacterium]|nr:hypothetical protein [Marinilabiliales bacterium]